MGFLIASSSLKLNQEKKIEQLSLISALFHLNVNVLASDALAAGEVSDGVITTSTLSHSGNFNLKSRAQI